MTQEKLNLDVVVLCTNVNGDPVFHTAGVPVSEEGRIVGLHHLLAKQDAVQHGYQGPMMAFDSIEQAVQELQGLVSWVSDDESMETADVALAA